MSPAHPKNSRPWQSPRSPCRSPTLAEAGIAWALCACIANRGDDGNREGEGEKYSGNNAHSWIDLHESLHVHLQSILSTSDKDASIYACSENSPNAMGEEVCIGRDL